MISLNFNINLVKNYKNKSQIARVLTEDWVEKNLYCPKCGNNKISRQPNNTPVGDFYCPKCNNQYELKSKKGFSSKIIPDGAFDTMIARITSNDNPDFLFMTHLDNHINNLSLIPKYFFTPEIIIKRAPLSVNSRRAGWVGCNIDSNKIPLQGYIPIIKNGVILDVCDVVSATQKAEGLRKDRIESRGWLFDILNYVNLIKNNTFSLEDIYKYENELSYKYPNNNNIKAKIRQQLQFLRDKGYIKFVDKGVYIHGWLMDVLECVGKCGDSFSISDIYNYESLLSVKHPENNNIRPKIRQQLQILRDFGYIDFIGNGIYKKTNKIHKI